MAKRSPLLARTADLVEAAHCNDGDRNQAQHRPARQHGQQQVLQGGGHGWEEGAQGEEQCKLEAPVSRAAAVCWWPRTGPGGRGATGKLATQPRRRGRHAPASAAPAWLSVAARVIAAALTEGAACFSSALRGQEACRVSRVSSVIQRPGRPPEGRKPASPRIKRDDSCGARVVPRAHGLLHTGGADHGRAAGGDGRCGREAVRMRDQGVGIRLRCRRPLAARRSAAQACTVCRPPARGQAADAPAAKRAREAPGRRRPTGRDTTAFMLQVAMWTCRRSERSERRREDCCCNRSSIRRSNTTTTACNVRWHGVAEKLSRQLSCPALARVRLSVVPEERHVSQAPVA